MGPFVHAVALYPAHEHIGSRPNGYSLGRLSFVRHDAACSVSAAGNCYDNAVVESFFATLKKELVYGCAFETRSEAYDAISGCIENYYNAKRRHSAAGKPSPINFELANSGQLAA